MVRQPRSGDPPRLHWSEGTLPAQVAPLLAPLWDLGPLPVRRGGASAPQAWASAPQRRALLVEGWDDVAEESGGHWVGVTHDGTIRFLSRGHRPLATLPDQYAVASVVLASIPRVYAVWYAVLPAPGAPPQPPQHQYPPRRTTPLRKCGSQPASSCGRGGNAAGCRSSFTRPDPGVRAPASVPLPPPPCPPPPPPGRMRVSPSPPPPHPARDTATGLPPRGPRTWTVCTACMASRYAESLGQPLSAPQAACEPQDRPSNQIKSNQIKSPPPPSAQVHPKTWVLGTFFSHGKKIFGAFGACHTLCTYCSMCAPYTLFSRLPQRSLSVYFSSPVPPLSRAKREDAIDALLYFRFKDRITGPKRQKVYNEAQKACATIFLSVPMATRDRFRQV